MQKKRKNIVRRICRTFEEKIRSGELKPGDILPSNHELAVSMKVSLMSANRAFERLANDGYVRREQGRGTYVSDSIPKQKVTLLKIGIADEKNTFPDVRNNLVMNSHVTFVTRYLKKIGTAFRIIPYEEVSDKKALASAAADLDGILLAGTFIDPVTTQNIEELGLPVVCLWREYPVSGFSFHQVIPDHRPGIRKALNEIIRRRYPEIYIIRERHRNAIARCRALLEELVRIRYDMKKVHIFTVEHNAVKSSLPCCRLGLQLSQSIAGRLVVTTSDVAAFILLDAFHDSGLEAGKDFELLSFDDLESIGYLPEGEPVLTTIRHPVEEIARRAADLLIETIENPSAERRLLFVPTDLVIRKTAFLKI